MAQLVGRIWEIFPFIIIQLGLPSLDGTVTRTMEPAKPSSLNAVTTQYLFILLPSPPHDKHGDWLQLIKYKLGSTFKLCILYQKTFHLEDVQGEEGHKLVNT